MANDVLFKTKAFGGFNKDEVMAYINRAISEKGDLEKQLINANSTIARLNGKIRELESNETALKAVKSELETAKAQIDELKENSADTDALYAQIEQLKNDVAVSDLKAVEIQVTCDSLQKELDEAKQSVGSTDDETESLKAENARLKSECARMKAMEQQVGAAMLDARLHSDELVKEAKEKANNVTREIYSAIGDTAVKIDDLSTGISEIARNFTKAVEEVELRINALTGNMSKTAQALISDNVLKDEDIDMLAGISDYSVSFKSAEAAFDDITSDDIASDSQPEFINESETSPDFNEASDSDVPEVVFEAECEDIPSIESSEDEIVTKRIQSEDIPDIVYYTEGESEIEFL